MLAYVGIPSAIGRRLQRAPKAACNLMEMIMLAFAGAELITWG